MPTVTSRDGTSIAFDRVGSGPALILVDAAGGFRGFGPMTPLAELPAHDFTVITYDRRGRGESGDTLPYAVDREVEDIQALIEVAGGSAFAHGFLNWGVGAAEALPNGSHRTLEGEWHGVAPEVLAPAMAEFFTSQ